MANCPEASLRSGLFAEFHLRVNAVLRAVHGLRPDEHIAQHEACRRQTVDTPTSRAVGAA